MARKAQDGHAALVAYYRTAKLGHQEAVRRRVIANVLGASVIRVFARGTKPHVVKALKALDIKAAGACRTQAQYDEWFEAAVGSVHAALRRGGNESPALKWGHATKIVSLYMRDVCELADHLPDALRVRLEGFLYNPLDSRVLLKLRSLGCVSESALSQMHSRERFYAIQAQLKDAADVVAVPRVWFDDVWAVL